MAASEEYRAEYGVKQVADALHYRLSRYLEAQYHIRDTGIVAERRKLFEEIGTIGKQPYLETTPTYALGQPYAELGLPSPVGETLTELTKWKRGVGVFPRPYHHQAEALQSFLNGGEDLIVATGTGSGKTEAFLFPILGHLLQEASQRNQSFQLPGFRALLLYPMNALVSDQVSRLRRLFGDVRIRDLFLEGYGRFPRFGMYTSRTPYPGARNSKKDPYHMQSVLRYYLSLESPDPDLSPTQLTERAHLVEELHNRGKWPAKDLKGFYGHDGERWEKRLKTQPGDRELLMRHEMHHRCPDILVTNYSMLEYMLLRPIERSIFQQTREWLRQDERNSLVLVLDEAHMYRGVGGAEVALLIRRLQARLGIPREQMRCILTSASLGSRLEAERAVKEFAVGLTGHPIGNPMPFRLIQGQREKRPAVRPGTNAEANHFADFELSKFFQRAEDLLGATNAIVDLAEKLGWPRPSTPDSADDLDSRKRAEDRLRAYLYQQLYGFGPMELLISKTAGNATAFAELAQTLFPGAERAERASEALLALGTYAHNGERVLLPTRVHLFFRGLPSLFACVNRRCEVRRHQPGEELLLGRLYTEPRTHCACSVHARVYELFTHRDCGAAFLRVFNRELDRTFYWHERGGTVERVGKPLEEDFLLVGDPHPDERDELEPVWLDMATGQIKTMPPQDIDHYQQFWRSTKSTDAGNNRPMRQRRRRGVGQDVQQERNKESVLFTKCPVCKKRSTQRIMDLMTKGEQPFANLVREQLMLQPADKKQSAQFPNGGRKVLLFSDGRQKAARLARDLPREVESDSFRQALILAAHRLSHLIGEATLDHRLYAAFVDVCNDFHLHFFDREERSQKKLLDDIKRYQVDYDADLQVALDEDWVEESPLQYKLALLRQLADPFYSLYAACAAYTKPTQVSLRKLKRRLSNLPAEFLTGQLESVAMAWLQALLEKTAFDPSISEQMRKRVDEFFKPLQTNSAIARIERTLIERAGLNAAEMGSIREGLYEVFTRTDASGHAYLLPASLALVVAVDSTWVQCASCRLTYHLDLLSCCVNCSSDKLELLPPEHPYMQSRKGYWREPLRAVLSGAQPIHVTAEEHTAQLSQRDAGVVYATTEEYELRFQDVPLGQDKPPVDVLSCTTTMEVGIDIGALNAIGLRNVPPQRENYQQRAGRAGRRGTAVSTVVTYAQGGPHDNFYYQYPELIISGDPRQPKVKIDNRRLAGRHINSFLIQTFFHEQLDRMDVEDQREMAETRTNLMSALGPAADFFGSDSRNLFSLPVFRNWLKVNLFDPPMPLADVIATWLPDELCGPEVTSEIDRLAEKRAFAAEAGRQLISEFERIAPSYITLGHPSETEHVGGTGAKPASGEDAVTDDEGAKGLLIDVMFDKGLLPSYAFPTNLCTFYIFENDGNRVRIKERPQQGKDKALSEYAPGRLLVVNKETYRVGGIYVEGTNSAKPAEQLFSDPLDSYVYCPQCTYVRLDHLQTITELCPVCGTALKVQEILDPPGFSPERGKPLNERDRDQEISYATSAQFPTPIDPDRFTWKVGIGRNLSYTFEQNQRLAIVNKGPKEEGFRVCESCGAAWPESEVPTKSHNRPFQIDGHILRREGLRYECNGPLHSQPLYLGYSFITDLLLLRIALRPPINYDPLHPWLHDALRTAADAITLAASLQLHIDPGELSAGYRLMPMVEEDPTALALADIYLFDTAAGGAGYAAEAGDSLSQILEGTLSILQCPNGGCERSCTECLRHYGNRYWHERLDRHLAAQIIKYATLGVMPTVVSISEQANQLTSLQRYLELKGLASGLGNTLNGTKVPLLTSNAAAAKRDRRSIVVGTYPALLDINDIGFAHPLHALDGEDGVMVILLNDYIVARDLPSSYQLFCRDSGIA